ncbi:hypothetical protein P7E02_14265 [Enterococcus hulanensis]|uniref:DUF1659 domain-containing protein n=1 Tax=Enterococcus hulanensis TaxID=2559929 RepID=UPI00288DAA5D|nr:hypothetical protein [Enterococcus hulanensis]MDT2661040.1 hypothetical protein [Enterococcus hulanensis]
MIQPLSNKLQVLVDQGAEKLKKISFQNIIYNPTSEQIIELGEIMTALSPDDSYLDSVILTTQTRYSK